MEQYSLVEIIEQAVQTEKLGNELYSSMAERFAKDQKLRILFETLAARELAHKKTFSDLKESLGDQKIENPEEVSNFLRAVVESEFFLGSHKSLPSLEHLRSIDDAVKYALGFEKETLLYFLGLRDIVKEKGTIDEIITEEKKHIAWLNDFQKAVKG